MGGGPEKWQELSSQLNRELSLGQQHFANAAKLSDLLEKCHLQQETKSPKGRKGSRSPARANSKTKSKKDKETEESEEETQPELLRVKVSGGPNGRSFEVGTQAQTMKKLTEKYPGHLEWAKSSLDIVIIPNEVTKPSATSEKMLKKNGKFMHYDEFVNFMSGFY
jgi:hypothetical protein